MSKNRFDHYPKTEFFEVVDTIGVPHPFMIGSKHVFYASDKHSGVLGKEAILGLEKKLGRPSCELRGCTLSYEQHEQALLVRCKTKDPELTQAYLKSIVALCEKEGFAGFTLLDGTEQKGEENESV